MTCISWGFLNASGYRVSVCRIIFIYFLLHKNFEVGVRLFIVTDGALWNIYMKFEHSVYVVRYVYKMRRRRLLCMRVRGRGKPMSRCGTRRCCHMSFLRPSVAFRERDKDFNTEQAPGASPSFRYRCLPHLSHTDCKLYRLQLAKYYFWIRAIP